MTSDPRKRFQQIDPAFTPSGVVRLGRLPLREVFSCIKPFPGVRSGGLCSGWCLSLGKRLCPGLAHSRFQQFARRVTGKALRTHDAR